MLSSLGSDAKNSARNNRSGSSKYFEVPRGFSVHVFKTPAASSYPHGATGKVAQSRPTGTGVWSKSSGYLSRFDNERKPSLTPSAAYRTAQPSVYEGPFDSKRGKSSKTYGIYPSSAGDMYIYERSISSVSDVLASSPSSSSSDSDILSESAFSASVEISSTRASSSTETLETTALVAQNATSTALTVPYRSSPASAPPRGPSNGVRTSPPGLHSAPPNTSLRPGVPAPTFTLPINLTTAETVSDSDSDTVIDDPVIDMLAPPRRPSAAEPREDSRQDSRTTGPSAPSPVRRSSDDRTSTQPVSRARSGSQDQRHEFPSPQSDSSQYRQGSSSNLRVPPGLTSLVTKAADGVDPPRRAVPPLSVAPGVCDPRPSAPPITRNSSVRPADTSPSTQARPPPTGEPKPQPTSTTVNGVNGRNGDIRPEPSGPLPSWDNTLTVATRRCVRWTEDLICPSPIPRSERRRGWFNRRGDQLWTNDGRFKSPELGQEYPPDLACYPEPNTGWMNEEGVRIDMEHRLMPKAPLRSALKRPKLSATQ
ncbi:hypothetical protein AcW1_001909 [Taiwanofungus camphoratus]|nr:hypothetical protein AcW1_001909 [Antrodia cinnamomea]